MSSLVETEILDTLRPRIGERLRAVEYGDSCDEEYVASYPLDDPDLALDGGVLLRFEGGDLLVTANGVNDWVVSATGGSNFADYLKSFDAGGLPYWRSFLGQTLVSASVLGYELDELEPTAIRLNFSTGSVLVWVAGGEGSIYVSWPDSKSYLSDLEPLWTSENPDVIRSISPAFTGAPLTDDKAHVYPLALSADWLRGFPGGSGDRTEAPPLARASDRRRPICTLRSRIPHWRGILCAPAALIPRHFLDPIRRNTDTSAMVHLAV